LPEGDTIYRAARTLNRALAGRTITRFESVFPRLTRVDHDRPLPGRTIERVEARGKQLLIWFSGDLVLRTHMRMHGSWHIYRPGERWQRPRGEMRIVIGTAEYEAVAFTVPVAEFTTEEELAREPAVRDLGPDLLADDFDADDAVGRIAALAEIDTDIMIADALLDQRVIAGIGNIFKSETLFAARVNPFTRVAALSRDELCTIVATGRRLMRANVAETHEGLATYAARRRTTTLDQPTARLWVYARAGRPCRRCGTSISRRAQGPHARPTYWCVRCQPTTRKPLSKDGASQE
jgi:endonuclease-8